MLVSTMMNHGSYSHWNDINYNCASSFQPPQETNYRPTPTRAVSARGPQESTENSQQEQEKPKRNLSAYNIFFKTTREKILADIPEPTTGKKPRRSHGKIGFAQLARTIAAKWKSIDDEERNHFFALAAQDKQRYTREMNAWKAGQSSFEKLTPQENFQKGTHQAPFARSTTVKNANFMSLMKEPLPGGPLTPTFSSMYMPHPQMYSAAPPQEDEYQPLPAMEQVLSGYNVPQQQESPAPLNTEAPSISRLAEELDYECMDLLVNSFRP